MAYSTLPIAGINLETTQSAAEIALYGEPVDFGPLGTQTFGSDGLRYVFAKAGGAIAAGATDVTVNASTFAATATGGAYLSPATAMVTGDSAWFSKASV